MPRPAQIFRLMRPHQWLKNGFVFVGLLFGHGWTDPRLVAQAVCLFAGFCLASSAVYVVNDIADREADRRHPAKRDRPIARGAVSLRSGFALSVAFALVGLGLAAAVSPPALAIVAAYIAINLAYSGGLKHVAILDVFIIAAGFMLRILAGTLGLGIEPSQWLLLCGLMVTLFLGFSKRRTELGAAEGDHSARRSLDDYSESLLDRMIMVTVAASIICYALYTVDDHTIALHGTDKLVFSLPFVAYGLFRYLYVLYRRGGGADPAWELVRDPHLLLATAGWLATTWYLIA